MSFGRPSFRRLFQRSHYRQLAPNSLADDDVARSERERFAASAIAFCLKHDPEFRTHFWKTVCWSQSNSEKVPSLNADTIWLEPPSWADLSLRYSDDADGSVWIVIEVKADASLKDKQNPSQKEFFAVGTGYGASFLSEGKKTGCKMRYVVLGADEDLKAVDGTIKRGIEIYQRSWEVLLHGRPTNPLINDLVSSLGDLPIASFAMEQAKKIEVTDGLENVGNVWRVVEAVADNLSVPKSKRQWDAYSSLEEGANAGGDDFGMYLKHPDSRTKASAAYTALSAMAKDQEYVAWLGYSRYATDKFNKSVFLYCKTEFTRDELAKKLAKRFTRVEAGKEGMQFFVVVEPSLKSSEKDFDWFVSVVEGATRSETSSERR